MDLDAGDNPEMYEHNIGMTTADDISRMLRKFHGGVEYSDAPSGFFGYLREKFETLAREEELAARREALEVVDYPSFGHQDDGHEDFVKGFYAAWNGFATKKTFSWRDKYRTSDAPDRRTRRYIEKENKQFREDAIREFNDAVRTLVAFVRKRDPRYTPNTQSELEREKALREAANARAAKMRAENAAKMDKEVLPEWAKFREPDEVEEMDDEESEEEQFGCVACRKTFKSENQFEAHERSKKHVKAVQALRRKMQKEGIALDIDSEEDISGAVTPQSVEAFEPVEQSLAHNEHHDKVDDETNVSAQNLEDAHTTTLNSPLQDLDINKTHDPLETANSDDSSPTSNPEKPKQSLEDPLASDSNSDSDSKSIAQPDQAPKLGKAAQKRAKKAAQAAGEQAQDSQHRCATCNATFPSKTRLFQHIKDHGHAAPVAAGKAKGPKGKRK